MMGKFTEPTIINTAVIFSATLTSVKAFLRKIIIKYNRSYYRYKNIRLTLDKNIKFENFTKGLNNSMVSKTSDLIVAEIKYSSEGDLIELFHKLPFEKTRFSKYCIGLETLNLV